MSTDKHTEQKPQFRYYYGLIQKLRPDGKYEEISSKEILSALNTLAGIPNREAALTAAREALLKVPIVRTGEPGTDEFLTCIGCGATGSHPCKTDCWVLGVEAALALLTPRKEGE